MEEVLLVDRDQGVVAGDVVTLRDLAHLGFLLDATLRSPGTARPEPAP